MGKSSVPEKTVLGELQAGTTGTPPKATIPLTTRLAVEIPKPKDWQAFQRNCVLLFRAELNDPNAQEYGRPGQKQKGIDVLARRGGRDEHFVGVQCRLVTAPLKEKKILSDAREALTLKADIKELIFATSAPDDTGAADAAVSVTRLLKDEGHELTVIVYGWGQLQTLIALHEAAYNAFYPSAVASTNPQNTGLATEANDLAALVAARVVEQLRSSGLAAAPREGAADATEDPALHARIDTYRDLFKEHDQPLLAERALLGMLEQEDLTAKPWANYRIETNLGVIAIALGREAAAASRFEAAHAIRPMDPNALANLALARTLQGQFEVAMRLAQSALEGDPRADYAVGHLLQAAARAEWQGDPATLIPADLVGSALADLGMAEFLRRREVPGWAEQVVELARRHPETQEFNRSRAIAVLSLALESGEVIAGAHGPATAAELTAAANEMKALIEHYLDIGFADLDDLVAYLNNAALLLRICERHAEAEDLLVRGMPKVGDQPHLRRLLAIVRLADDRETEAIAVLENDTDPENGILLAELQANIGDHATALAKALSIDGSHLPDRLQRLRWQIVGESALQVGDQAALDDAIAGLRSIDPHDVRASLLEIKAGRKTLADEAVVQEQLRCLAAGAPPNLDMVSRYFIALELRNHDLAEEASRLLEGHVDLSRPNPAVMLYLRSLASARRDAAFHAALKQAAPEVRNDPSTLWAVAAHAWNLGDLGASSTAVDALLSLEPSEPRARLLKIEIFIRQDRSNDLFTELEKPLEALAWKSPNDQFRLASLLGHFGFVERAAALAYSLFLQHRDISRAWMTLSMLVLDEGRGEEDKPGLWDVTEVSPDAAVDLTYDDGSTLFFVVEPNVLLRKLDPQSWEPEHALVRAVAGLRAGAQFVGPDGREGVIKQLRHKYVARLHYVMEHHEARFPEITGFRRVPVDVDQPGGLDGLIAAVKARHDWVQEEENQYRNGPVPLGIFAHRLGMDTIDAAAGLAGHGGKLKVAVGSLEEREQAGQIVRLNGQRGCVLDLLAFWTAWRLEALEALQLTCGSINLPRSVLDRLRARREQYEFSARDGHKTAGYDDGRIILHEVPGEVVAGFRDEVDRAIAWASANAIVLPVVASDDLPAALREHLRLGQSDVFDALVLARQNEMLLVSDDVTIREIDRVLGGDRSTWLQATFGVALDQKQTDLDRYVRWSANLVDAGQNYLGVSGAVLTHAARLDAELGKVPGYLFGSLSQIIGGEDAEIISHYHVTISCLGDLWTDHGAVSYRQPATGHLLRQLVRGREGDYVVILRAVLLWAKQIPALYEYTRAWLRGHFLAGKVLE